MKDPGLVPVRTCLIHNAYCAAVITQAFAPHEVTPRTVQDTYDFVMKLALCFENYEIESFW